MEHATNPKALNLQFMKAILDGRGEKDLLQPLPLETASKENWASMESAPRFGRDAKGAAWNGQQHRYGIDGVFPPCVQSII